MSSFYITDRCDFLKNNLQPFNFDLGQVHDLDTSDETTVQGGRPPGGLLYLLFLLLGLFLLYDGFLPPPPCRCPCCLGLNATVFCTPGPRFPNGLPLPPPPLPPSFWFRCCWYGLFSDFGTSRKNLSLRLPWPALPRFRWPPPFGRCECDLLSVFIPSEFDTHNVRARVNNKHCCDSSMGYNLN